MFCQYCGSQLPDDAKVCSNCGTPIGETGPAAEPIEQPQETAYTYNTYDQAPVYEMELPYSGLGIAGFVVSFFLPVLGIILSAVALGQIKRGEARGKGLATAGLVLGIVFTAIWFLLIALSTCVAVVSSY